MFIKHRYFWQGGLLFLASVTGLLFPSFIKYVFVLGVLTGIGAMVYAWFLTKAK
jgi:hypothetical protein